MSALPSSVFTSGILRTLLLCLQVGLSEPHRIGQAKEVRVELRDSVPLQIDGEPWEQHPAVINIVHHSQVST